MFGGSKPHYIKLRTNLRLCVNRLKLIEKKKTEIALKARCEIADYLKVGKDDRARIRVEHIVREDYLVEAMEIVEMYCDLLLARFGLIEKMKDIDPGLTEPIATILWATPRMSSDIPELREVANQLTMKYGKEYNNASRSNLLEQVNEKVLHKMALVSPPKKLIESYLLEIARTYSIEFEPDPTAFEETHSAENLIDIGFDSINSGKGGRGGGGGGGGGMMMPLSPDHTFPPPMNPDAAFYPPAGAPQYHGEVPPPAAYNPPPPGASFIPPLPSQPPVGPVLGSAVPPGSYPGSAVPPGSYPGSASNEKVGFALEGGFTSDQYQPPPGGPQGVPVQPPQYDDVFGPPLPSSGGGHPPPPLPQAPPAASPPGASIPDLPAIPVNDLPTLPSVPSGFNDSVSASGGAEDIDFDDLTRRFEILKKKK